MAAMSPLCEFDFPAARARSVKIAAMALSSKRMRRRKTGHSCVLQQNEIPKGQVADNAALCSRRVRVWNYYRVLSNLRGVSSKRYS